MVNPIKFKKNSYEGLFIVFEGLDGSGSSTQASMLSSKLRENGYVAFSTKEPTNNIIGGLIRGQLTHDWSASLECLELLFAADRAHHLDREIIPALKDKRIIISDRYFFSTVAFGSLELDKNWLIELNRQFIYPDITFILKVPAKDCIKRMKKSRFEMELFEEEKKLTKTWHTYAWLAENYPNVYVIDGTQSINQIHGEVYEIIKGFLKKKKIEGKTNLLNFKN